MWNNSINLDNPVYFQICVMCVPGLKPGKAVYLSLDVVLVPTASYPQSYPSSLKSCMHLPEKTRNSDYIPWNM